jgi:hypothetical protein
MLEEADKNEVLNTAITRLFKAITELRTYITGEVYVLNVETSTQQMIEVDLGHLLQEGAIVVNGANIEYRLALLKEELEGIKLQNTVYQNLVNRIFP